MAQRSRAHPNKMYFFLFYCLQNKETRLSTIQKYILKQIAYNIILSMALIEQVDKCYR